MTTFSGAGCPPLGQWVGSAALRDLIGAAMSARTGHGWGGHGRGGRGWGGPPPWARPGSPWGQPFDVFGGGAWRGHARRRGSRGRGDVRLAIVGLLAEEPMHGYQLIQEITARSEGRWRPSPGSVYPTLAQLEDEGLVRAEDAEGRRVFRLTDEGRRLAAERSPDFAALWSDDTEPVGGGIRELGEVLFQVGGAAVQVASAGSEAQRRAATELLERTRRELYLLLAEDAPEDDDASEDGSADDTGRAAT